MSSERGLSLTEVLIGIAITLVAGTLAFRGWTTYSARAQTERNRDVALASIQDVAGALRKITSRRVVPNAFGQGVGSRLTGIVDEATQEDSRTGVKVIGRSAIDNVWSCKTVEISTINTAMSLDKYSINSKCRTLAADSPLRDATYNAAFSTMGIGSCNVCGRDQVPIVEILKNGRPDREFPAVGATDAWPVGITVCGTTPYNSEVDRLRLHVRAFFVTNGEPGDTRKKIESVDESVYIPLKTNQNLQMLK